MVLRHGRWLWSYQERSMHWIIGALDVSWTYIGRNLSPMMRYVPALGTRQPFLSDTVRSRRLSFICDVSTATTPDRIITELSRPVLRAHLTTGDGGLVVQSNPGWEPWRPTCNLWILDWRLRSDALRTNRLGGNSWQRLYVFSNTLLKRERKYCTASRGFCTSAELIHFM